MEFLFESPIFGTCFLVFTAILTILLAVRRRKNDGIPSSTESSLYTAQELLSSRAPNYMLSLVKKYGSIFKLVLPLDSLTVVTDPQLMRIIFEGDVQKGTKCTFDKGPMYSRFTPLTCGYHTIVTKKTEGDGWEVPRKGLAPCFSMININK
eukprot:gene16440-34308_t